MTRPGFLLPSRQTQWVRNDSKLETLESRASGKTELVLYGTISNTVGRAEGKRIYYLL